VSTVAVVFLIVFACALLLVGRTVWRFLRGNDQLEPAGSFGRQFFGRRTTASKPDDWLEK
jgi:hypothetical protein